jgi:hypothetical protein
MDELLRLSSGGAPSFPPKSRMGKEDDMYLAIKQELDIIRQQTSNAAHWPSRTKRDSLDVQVKSCTRNRFRGINFARLGIEEF